MHDSREIMMSGLHIYGSCSKEEALANCPLRDCWGVTSDTECDGSVQEHVCEGADTARTWGGKWQLVRREIVGWYCLFFCLFLLILCP